MSNRPDDFGNNPYASPPTSSFEFKKPAKPGWGDQQLATRLERFLGAMIDGIIMAPILIGLVFGLTIALISFGVDFESLEFDIISTVVGALIGISLFLVVQGYFLATSGQTVGKLVMKTQIVSEKTGQILPFGELILKRYAPIWALSYIPWIGNFIGLINALLIFRESRKCLHDDFAGTKVIKLR